MGLRNDVQAFGLPVLQIVREMLQLEAPTRNGCVCVVTD